MKTKEERQDIVRKLREVEKTEFTSTWCKVCASICGPDCPAGCDEDETAVEVAQCIADLIDPGLKREYVARNSKCAHYELCMRYNFDIDCNCPEFTRLDEWTDRKALIKISDYMNKLAKDAIESGDKIDAKLVLNFAETVRKNCRVNRHANE